MGKYRRIQDFWKELGFNTTGQVLRDKYPLSSKNVRCNLTPYINYPLIEKFNN